MDLRLHCNRTMCVAGPSHSGKTTFVLDLLDRKENIFKCAPQRVIWCYGEYQSQLNPLLQSKGYLTQSGAVKEEDIRPYDIIVLDDLLHETKNSSDVTAMFTRAAHHKPCFVIFIMQNLFPPGKEARTRSLNTHYYVIFKNPRDTSQFEYLARQTLPHNSKALIRVYQEATAKPHSYLFIDFTQECPDDYRFRSSLFEKALTIYRVQ